MKIYYYLKKGEIIKEGDEVEMSSNYNDPPKWVKGNPNNIGSPAPDPTFISHRKYRREITFQSYMNVNSSEERMVLLKRIFEVVEQVARGVGK